MKYLFIVGRNVELSTEEIKSFFERDKIPFKIISLIRNGILIETESLKKGIIEKFGGVISIGEVLAEGNEKEILDELKNKTLYFGNSNKMNYVIHDFDGKNFDEISLYLKKRFREESLKSTQKKLTGILKMQNGKTAPNVASNLINEQYFVFEKNFGRIIEKYNYDAVEKRDMGKPVRRSELSISPRLAKILINLSQVREGEILLDPFCGIGVVLQEALLQKIKVIGIDNDKNAISNARINLKWFNFSEQDYKLIHGDSVRVGIQKVDSIATEPNLGELHKKIPTEAKANEIIGKFEKLITMALKNLKKNVRGKIVFTAPLVQTINKKISCDFKKICSITGLRIKKGFPINEFREDSIVGRSIVVLEN